MNETAGGPECRTQDNPWRDSESRAAREFTATETPVEPEPRDEPTLRQWDVRPESKHTYLLWVVGAVIGLAAGEVLLSMRFGNNAPWFVKLPIRLGCILFFAQVLSGASRDPGRSLGWFIAPEIMLFSRMPLWVMVVIILLIFALLVGLWCIFVFSRFQ